MKWFRGGKTRSENGINHRLAKVLRRSDTVTGDAIYFGNSRSFFIGIVKIVNAKGAQYKAFELDRALFVCESTWLCLYPEQHEERILAVILSRQSYCHRLEGVRGPMP